MYIGYWTLNKYYYYMFNFIARHQLASRKLLKFNRTQDLILKVKTCSVAYTIMKDDLCNEEHKGTSLFYIKAG